MSKKILILGGDGMAGNMIKTFLEEKGHDVYSTTRRKKEGKRYFFDVLENYNAVEEIVADVKPNFVINCIGVLNQYAEENKAAAVLINSFLPHYIDSLSKKYDFKLVHISTDCVFSGEKGDYVEDSFPDAPSFYGRSKSLGEINNEKNLTFRTSIVGPDINDNGIGLFNWFMKQSGEVKGFSKVIWTGVTTLELAKNIEKSFDTDITGLFHLVNNEKINKHDLLTLLKKYTGKKIDIKADDAYVSDKSLLRSRTDVGFEIPSYEQMIKEMGEWIDGHPEKYKQIILNKNL